MHAHDRYGIISAFTTTLEVTTIAAITMSTPIMITVGAVLFLGETVGVTEWAAILIGFAFVLLIIRPGSEGVWDPNVGLVLVGTAGMAVRLP